MRCFAVLATAAALAWAAAAPALADVSTYPGVPARANPAGVSAAVAVTVCDDARKAAIAIIERRGGTVLAKYDVDMTKLLHLIVVSDDFTSFEHVHPILGKNGTFTLDLSVPKPGNYHLYADAEPTGVGHTVFRFDVPFGGTMPKLPHLDTVSSTATTGPYVVKLSTLTLHAGKDTVVNADVSKNGKPAKDLTPYLGGMAHAVFINAQTLDYVHVHPMSDAMKMMCSMGGDMSNMDMSRMTLPDGTYVNPHMILHVKAPVAGTYKLWLQFRGGGELHVAPFVLTAR